MIWFLTAAAAFQGDVVMLGNSYTFFNDLPSLLDGALRDQGHEASVTGLTAGGLRLPEHLARIEGDNPQWQGAFDGDRWEVVVMQDQSQIPGFPEGQAQKAESLAALPQLDTHGANAGAESWLFLTWGRRSGDGQNQARYPDYTSMQDLLDQGYLLYRDRIRAEERPGWVVPVGAAFRRVHDQILAEGGNPQSTDSAFWTLYTDDGSHPSPRGSWLATSVFYASLTGCDPTALETDSIPSETADALEQIAREVVLEGQDGGLGLSYPWADSPCGRAEAEEPAEASTAAPSAGCGCHNGSAALFFLLPLLGRRRTS